MMNVLYLIGSLAMGGKERLLLDVIERRKVLPFEACVVCRKGSGDMDNGVVSISSKRIIPFLFRLRKEIRNRRIHIVHAQSAYDAMLALLATMFLKTKVVQTFHSYEFCSTKMIRLLESFTFTHCAKSIFVSRQQMRRFADLHRLSNRQKSKQHLIYNGVDFERFPLVKRTNNQRLKMAMVGNFVPEKDQLFVCEFLKKLSQVHSNFDFYFIGELKSHYPECYERCINYCNVENLNGSVHFLGKRDDVPELLSNMDAFIYSSHSETFGLAVVEAVSVGVPSFVNDLPVFQEILQNGRLANIYPTRNLLQLFNIFSDFLAHRQSYQQQAADNACQIRNIYSITTYISNLDSLYSQII